MDIPINKDRVREEIEVRWDLTPEEASACIEKALQQLEVTDQSEEANRLRVEFWSALQFEVRELRDGFEVEEQETKS